MWDELGRPDFYVGLKPKRQNFGRFASSNRKLRPDRKDRIVHRRDDRRRTATYYNSEAGTYHSDVAYVGTYYTP